MTPTLDLAIIDDQGASPCSVQITGLWNFGYAARDQEGLRRHLSEAARRGLAVPATVPSLYGLPPDRGTISPTITVTGRETYAEVEYGLVNAPGEGWLVVAASDHTDGLVEEGNVSRGKAITPDVISPLAWRLADVEGHFDQLVLTCETVNDIRRVVQADTAASLLAPSELIAIAERRLGASAGPGTVLLSGTIGGEPPRGAARWRISLGDPTRGRTLAHGYTVDVVADEIGEPGGGRAVDS